MSEASQEAQIRRSDEATQQSHSRGNCGCLKPADAPCLFLTPSEDVQDQDMTEASDDQDSDDSDDSEDLAGAWEPWAAYLRDPDLYSWEELITPVLAHLQALADAEGKGEIIDAASISKQVAADYYLYHWSPEQPQ